MVTILVYDDHLMELPSSTVRSVSKRSRQFAFGAALLLCAAQLVAQQQLVAAQQLAAAKEPVSGDAPADPGPLANDLSAALSPGAVQAVIRRVADWQSARIANAPSQDWTFATLYVGLLAASGTLHDDRYRELVHHVADHFEWQLGPRLAHADDQAIGQSYLLLNLKSSASAHLAPMRGQFDQLMRQPDDPAKPVWWWCDALFMAPPVWSQLSAETGGRDYLTYMDREWRITSALLWDPHEQLFSRDASYLDKHEKNGRKVFWSRGNGWVMGGLVRVLETMPRNDPRRPFYVEKLKQMADSIGKLQGSDGLWRAGLLDAEDYNLPETSGSAFFVYAMAWGINHHLLDRQRYLPIVERGWAGLVAHVYQDGRLGCVQPVGERPGVYAASASSVFGTGALLLAGSEVNQLSNSIVRHGK